MPLLPCFLALFGLDLPCVQVSPLDSAIMYAIILCIVMQATLPRWKALRAICGVHEEGPDATVQLHYNHEWPTPSTRTTPVRANSAVILTIGSSEAAAVVQKSSPILYLVFYECSIVFSPKF